MIRRGSSILVATGVIVAGGWLGARKLGAFEPAPLPAATSSSAAMSEIGQRDTQIRVWKTALAQDPRSAIALGQLA
ncbi:MAG TPA: hypothetical protein VGJ64_04830, partial [Gemmatimonadaceae bacterium]